MASLGADEVRSIPSVVCCRHGRDVGWSSATDTGGGLSEAVTGLDEDFIAVSLALVGVGCAICEPSLENGTVNDRDPEDVCRNTCKTSELTAKVPLKLKYLTYVAGILKITCLSVCSVGVAAC